MRMSVACTTVRRSSACVSASRAATPPIRDHSPTYIDGAYCAWMPPTARSVWAIEPLDGSSSPWRASTARLSSRSVRTRSAADGLATRRMLRVAAYSHSIVPGGLDVMSSTTRLTSRSSLIIREAICSSRS